MLIVTLYCSIYILIFIFGATLASFMGLAVTRLPHQLKWRDNPLPNLTLWQPNSHCDRCEHPIKWSYLFPIIGYFICARHCKKCGICVALYYPIIELMGGIVPLVVIYCYGLNSKFLIVTLLYFSLFFLAWIDLVEHWLPAIITTPLLWVGLLYSPFNTLAIARVQGAACGFLITYAAMWLTSKICSEDIRAGGDIALITMAGAWLGISRLFYYILLSSLIFIIYALPARINGIRFCPMAPALCCGFIISLLPCFN